MTNLQQQRLMLALLISLLLHVVAVIVPGHFGAMPDDDLASVSNVQLEAYLSPLPGAQAPASEISAPATRKHRIRKSTLLPLPEAILPEMAAIEPPPAVPGGVPEFPGAAANLPPQQVQPNLGEGQVAVPRDRQVASDELALPRQGQIRFSISRGDRGFVVGQSVHRWSHDGKHYRLSSITETTGLVALFKPARVTQSSEGELDGTDLRPAEFRTERDGIPGEAATFDWLAMKVRLTAGSARDISLMHGAQDLLSMFYQLGAAYTAASSGPRSLMVATGRKFEPYLFEVLGEEMVLIRQGEFRTAHLRSVAGIEAIDVWLGLNLHGLPVKIRYTDRQGETFEQTADEIEFDSMPTTLKKR